MGFSLASLSSVESRLSTLQSIFSSNQPREPTTKQLCKYEILFVSLIVLTIYYTNKGFPISKKSMYYTFIFMQKLNKSPSKYKS